MFAHEPTITALTNIVDSSMTRSRYVLVKGGNPSVWRRLEIPGVETEPRLVNGMLAGTVSHLDPRSEVAKRIFYPSILSDSVVIIDPSSGNVWVTLLAQRPEVLWIEGGQIYFRVADSLYRARWQGTEISEQKLLIKDPAVLGFHWAFRGTTK